MPNGLYDDRGRRNWTEEICEEILTGHIAQVWNKWSRKIVIKKASLANLIS